MSSGTAQAGLPLLLLLLLSARGSLAVLQLHGGAPLGPSGGDEAQDPRHVPTIYCFIAAMPRPKEIELVRAHIDLGMLTGCDGYAVYSNMSVGQLLGPDYETRVPGGVAVAGSMDAPHDPEFHSTLNGGVFRQVWQQVFRDGAYKNYDWTVKIDADTAWVPSALRKVLADHKPVQSPWGMRQDPSVAPGAEALGNGGEDCMDLKGAFIAVNRQAMDFMVANWMAVVGANNPREDSMILVFMRNFCNCVYPEPRLSLRAECPLSGTQNVTAPVYHHAHKNREDLTIAHQSLLRQHGLLQ